MKKFSMLMVFCFVALSNIWCFDVGLCQSIAGKIRHSTIAMMFSEKDPAVLRAYGADLIAWGGQIPWPSKASINKQKDQIKATYEAGVKYQAVDFALIQEGTRYLSRTVDLWELDDLSRARLPRRMLEIIKSHAVLDSSGEIIGVPWNNDVLTPMACTRDPGYREWLFNRIDSIMLTVPDALHFDEPMAGAEALNAKRIGCLCDRCCIAFRKYLVDNFERVSFKYDVENIDTFNYREFVISKGGDARLAPLWKEFEQFQIFSAVELIKELRERAIQRPTAPVIFSANASPDNWFTLQLMPLIDYASVEVSHRAEKFTVADEPILTYKVGSSMRLPVLATALGSDWEVIIQNSDSQLVSAWIAQAYAFGNWMMMPHNAWTPKARYLPDPKLYAGLALWIKKMGFLLDGFEEISTCILIAPSAALRDANYRAKLVDICRLLCIKGVPYNFMLLGYESSRQTIKGTDFDESKRKIVLFPHLLSASERALVEELTIKGTLEVIEGHDVALKATSKIPTPIKIQDADGIFVLPRVRRDSGETKTVLHLLNRDYDRLAKSARHKGPFTITVDRVLVSAGNIQSAILHLPPNQQGKGEKSLEVKLKLLPHAYELFIPAIDSWGIIELIG